MSITSQNAIILNHLRNRGPITGLEALENYGCARLASRIHDLKEKGHNINKVMIKVGQRKYVARYSLITEAKQERML